MRIAVHALVFDKGRVLAVKGEGTELYSLPKALLKERETLASAAKRALKKETSIIATEPELQFVGIYDAVDRYPLCREVAAVLLARSWRELPADASNPKDDCWVPDFRSAPWAFDYAQILAEQGVFAPLSKRTSLFEMVKTDA
jgi:ADP-ribose pyrophosphatase YjhB (NUDIX family)